MSAMNKTLIKTIIISIIISAFCAACDKAPHKTEDAGMKVKINHSSGDDFKYDRKDSVNYFAPYPFNVGQITIDTTNQETMLISKRLEKGKEISIIPLASLRMKDKSGQGSTILIAIPDDKDLRIVEATSFYDFSVEHFAMKQMIELWYINRFGLQGTYIDGWRAVENLKDSSN